MRSSQLRLDLSPTFHRSGGSKQSFFDLPAQLLFQKPTGSKRCASYAGFSEDDKKKVKLEPISPSGLGKTICLSSDPPSGAFPWSQECKVKIKTKPGLPSKGITIVISSDPPSPSHIDSSQDTKKGNETQGDYEIYRSNTPGDSEGQDRAHAEALERFLIDCNVPPKDETTRMILERAALHLVSEAMDRVNELKKETDELQDEDSGDSISSRPQSPEF
ncbi:uncharacterized protein MELLADRAFT_79879 [Melampsora larici-populina 98AG31]|nr:uncharacterized protein MELLADRAFT_79879 [Melampsora larici-populina 98AG31]EGF96889.1 hypothetical protein MELLADRAFT_79879 [Melampsora larici-populina 98AG31]